MQIGLVVLMIQPNLNLILTQRLQTVQSSVSCHPCRPLDSYTFKENISMA